VRIEFISKPSIPYENGGRIALCVNGAVNAAIDEIGPLPEVEVVETMVVWIVEG